MNENHQELVSAADAEIAATERQKYLDLFLAILEKCPHAIAPNIGSKELVREVEEGARAIKAYFLAHTPL